MFEYINAKGCADWKLVLYLLHIKKINAEFELKVYQLMQG